MRMDINGHPARVMTDLLILAPVAAVTTCLIQVMRKLKIQTQVVRNTIAQKVITLQIQRLHIGATENPLVIDD
jgi:hypothetical protein